ncbi:GNAT family N-acetyltransferase [Gracilibacillus alcaliphilus]|uniref:GNAT family N-acetyltransferase n=1 Tax=Gracilibacillus alcaliphilus TaxID=1401441 RepID=UPI00195670F7|nr:GNAT family N-acetyltransferase [Gracilibacillus alcaliphilus]MBM7677803.1 GNAT superfamily N-acetyltransferase [Gracilibacillus alcaliphilus]
MDIHEVRQKEIEAVSAFLHKTMTEVYPFPLSLASLRDLSEMENLFLIPSRTTMIAAFLDGEVVGTIAVRPYDGRITLLDKRYHLATTCEIIKCYVKQDLRQQGIGSRLFQQARSFCKKAAYSMMYLHTHRFLPGGLSFWEKQGFSLIVDEQGDLETVHLEQKV